MQRLCWGGATSPAETDKKHRVKRQYACFASYVEGFPLQGCVTHVYRFQEELSTLVS